MDADDYLAAVREILQEPEEDVWTDVQLFRYLTWAQAKTWQHLVRNVDGDHFLEATDPMSLVSGTQEYTIPQGPNSTDITVLRYVERVWSTIEDFLERIPFDHRARYSSVSGTYRTVVYPQRYYLKFPKVGFAPEPGEDIADAVVFHGVFKLAAMAAGGSAPRFDDYEDCQRMCIVRAAMLAKHYDEQSDSSLAAEWNAAKNDLLVTLAQDDGAHCMRQTAEDGI